ncbi:MAG: LamG domain-containing protein, partial [Planctomycetota bacterium]
EGSLGFDDDTAIWVPTTTLNKLNDAITIIAWIEDGSNWALQANGGDSQLTVNFTGSNVVWRAGNNTNDVLTMGGDPSGWNHYVFIKDETEGNIQIYFNGELAESDDVVDNTLIGVRSKPFKIGGRADQPADFRNGRMDDFIVYDRALSGNEILRQYYAGGPVGKLELAWNPSPSHGQMDVAYDVVLTWEPGDYADSHDVFFGTNWDDVNDVNSSNYASYPNVDYNHTDICSYDPNGFLELGQLYYWRIDEVSDTCDASPWKGNVWMFTVADFITIDDFEDDSAQNPPSNDWYKLASATISLRSTPPIIGKNSMRYAYDNWWNLGPGYYSEIESISLEPNDWTALDMKILSLWFYGQSGNAATETEQMYVYLKDNDSNEFQVKYGDAAWEDMTDIQIEDWQEWFIPLSHFSTNDVNLANLDNLCIGFGIRGWGAIAGMGVVYFDNIRLHPLRCIPSLRAPPEADLNNDCEVDFEDVEIMADEWLEVDVNLSPVQPPSEANLVGWWKLDEAPDSNIATDYAGYDNNGVIETIDVNAWWVSGHDGNALEFDGGRVRVPDAQNLRPLDEVSACAWVKFSEDQDSARIVVKGADNKETFGLEVSDDDELVFLVRDGNNPNADSYEKYAAESDNDTLDRDEWIHAAGTYDGNSVRCYINGELMAKNDDPNNEIPFLSQDTNDLAIGNMSEDDRVPFEGTIDDVRVYNYALSAEEVAYIATDETGIFTVQSAANLYNLEDLGDRAVNLRDFAELAKGWLERKLWPE